MIQSIPSSRYDVVVVGARCAGAATALLLARAGHRVLVIDRGQYGTDTLSTHALMRGAVVQLHKWGLLPAVVASDTAPVRQATFWYGDDAVHVPVARRDGIEALYAPRRYVLDRLLVDAAAQAGADVVYGAGIRQLRRSDDGRVVGAVLQDPQGASHEVACRVLVGADGLYSTVARLVGAATYRAGNHAAATVYGHWTGLHAEGYDWYFVPGLSAAAIPTTAGHVCVSVSVPASQFPRRFKADVQAGYHQVLAEVAPALAGRVAAARLPGKIHGFAGHVGQFRQAVGPGWALVGDAGYFKDPITAHGITDALRDAEFLARAIDDRSDEALALYQERRDAASLELFDVTDAIASFAWNLSEVRQLHAGLASAMKHEMQQLSAAAPQVASAR